MIRMLMAASVFGLLATSASAHESDDDKYECKLPEKYLCGGNRGGDHDRGMGKGRERVAVCHKGRIIWVPQPAVRAHQRHGDTVGECVDNSRRRPARY